MNDDELTPHDESPTPTATLPTEHGPLPIPVASYPVPESWSSLGERVAVASPTAIQTSRETERPDHASSEQTVSEQAVSPGRSSSTARSIAVVLAVVLAGVALVHEIGHTLNLVENDTVSAGPERLRILLCLPKHVEII